MGLQYRKHKRFDSSDSQWTSYSDLFMGLSTVFLLLYVTTSLRTGTSGLQQQIEKERLTQEVQDLKNQLRVYETIKEDAIEKGLTQEDEQVYKDLITRLDLLEDSAKTEKEKMRQEAINHDQKEKALNHYQQMVRNVINANLIAKAKIKKRDEVIETKDVRISENEKLHQTQVAQLKTESVQKLKMLDKEKQKLAKQLGQTADQLGQAHAQLDETQTQLGQASTELDKTKSKLGQVAGQLATTEGELAKAKAEMDTRRAVAREIKKGFAKAGVTADVDNESGEVLLDFGDTYFATGKADLKPQMVEYLKKVFPVYAASLMDNPKVANKISAIEIIGFASPTYKGKLVDPNTLRDQDKKAVDYNMDLSYSRARSIFQFMFDPEKMQFKHQKDILPLIKVTGRSFLAEGKRAPAAGDGRSGSEGADFCSSHDCMKAQKVMIRFGLEKKKL